MDIQKDLRNVRPAVWIAAGITFALLYFLGISWLKWGNLVIDSYRDAWLAENLLKGKLLYRDLFCEYGFLPYYLLAGVFKLLGANNLSMTVSGIAVTVAVAYFLYKISRLFFDEAISGLTVFTFLAVFAFGNYQQTGIFNFILPYSIAATVLCLFCTVSFYFLLRFIISDEIVWLRVWAALFGFTFLCRPDIPLICWAGVAVGLFPCLCQTSHKKTGLIFWFFVPIVWAAVGYAVFFNLTGSFPDFYRQIVEHGMVVKSSTFQWSIIGLDHFGRNLTMMSFSLVMSIAAAALIAGGCVLMRRWNFPSLSLSGAYAGGFLIFAAFLSGIVWQRNFLQYYCLPFVLIVNMVYGLFHLKRNSTDRIAGAIFALSVISLALMVRVIFKPVPFSYGFYLLVASIPGYYLFFFYVLGGWAKKLVRDFPEQLYKAVLLFFFVMQACLWWNISQKNYGDKSIKIIFKRGGSYKGTVYANNHVSTQDYINAVTYLNKNACPGQTLVVFPDGVSMNFFTGLYNPIGHLYFLPITLSYGREEEIIERLKGFKVDYAVLLTRDASEYGAASFGIDYAKKITEWVKSHYELAKVFGDYPYTSQRGGIAIYKRK